MRIITQAIRVIDYENNKVLPRDIMPKFGEYIEQLISYIKLQYGNIKHNPLEGKSLVVFWKSLRTDRTKK